MKDQPLDIALQGMTKALEVLNETIEEVKYSEPQIAYIGITVALQDRKDELLASIETLKREVDNKVLGAKSAF